MRKLFLALAVALVVCSSGLTASTSSLTAYFFYGQGCPHCAKENTYLESLVEKYPNLKIEKFEIYYNPDNISLLQKVADRLGTNSGGVPFLVIGDKYFIGYGEGITPKEVEAQVVKCSSGCPDLVASIKILPNNAPAQTPSSTPQLNQEEKEKIINLPFVGEVNAAAFSLPVLTLVMGLLDGFNPCAMWTLLFLISLLLGLESRKRMWILGIAFIVASASVYFIFMMAWLNLILFLGFVVWVRLLIGFLALGGGGYSLKEFFLNRDSGCKVANDNKRQKVFLRLRAVVGQNSFWLALLGIIALALMVNLVELLCSAGLPAVYTQVLALNELVGWQYYLYILLYIFFFMLDDLLVFFVAMMTLEMTGLTTKYARYSRLIGGLLMVLIGLLLIFKPEWLMFG